MVNHSCYDDCQDFCWRCHIKLESKFFSSTKKSEISVVAEMVDRSNKNVTYKDIRYAVILFSCVCNVILFSISSIMNRSLTCWWDKYYFVVISIRCCISIKGWRDWKAICCWLNWYYGDNFRRWSRKFQQPINIRITTLTQSCRILI